MAAIMIIVRAATQARATTQSSTSLSESLAGTVAEVVTLSVVCKEMEKCIVVYVKIRLRRPASHL